MRKGLNSFSTIKIILFASIGYLFFPLLIKLDSIQYSTLPEKISMQVRDDSLRKNVYFNLPVKSKLRVDIDSVKAEYYPVSGIVSKGFLYQENPVFLVWLMLITIMITIAAGSFPFYIHQIKELRKLFHLKPYQVRRSVFISIAVALLLIASNLYMPGYYHPPEILENFHILLQHGDLLKLIEVTVVALLLPAIIVIFLTGVAADNIFFKKMPAFTAGDENTSEAQQEKLIREARQSIELAANNFNLLNQVLRNALQLLAIVVVFSVITSGVLGKAILSTIEIKGIEIYPAEICYVYGMFFSLFLLIVYVPSFLYLKYKYVQLRTSISEIEETDIIKDEKWFASIFGTIKFEGSPLDNFKMSLTVLAPLISSFLPEYLHFLK